MFGDPNPRVREAIYAAVAVLYCAAVAYLDSLRTSDTSEAFLLPLAFVLIYPIKRDWVTITVAAVAIGAVVIGAVLEPDGESLGALVVNRGMTVVVVVGVAFLLSRISRSDRRLEDAASTDPLTGVYNRRYFMAMLAREHYRAQRYSAPFSVLMLDIDHFKQIKDSHGRAIGDEAIKTMVAAASRQLRPSDLIGRLGGEAFAVLMPHTDEAGAVAAAGRIRRTVGAQALTVGDQTVRFTISIGIATHARWVTAEQVLGGADKALYAAKVGGHDQVFVSRPGEPGSASILLPA